MHKGRAFDWLKRKNHKKGHLLAKNIKTLVALVFVLFVKKA